MTGDPIRVVIVDDHPMYRLGLSATIGEMAGIEVVGAATSGAELTALLDSTAADVVLLDIGLPDVSGIDLISRVAVHHPDVRVLMLTMSDDLDTALRALGEGARGYLVKGAQPEELEPAIRTVAAGAVVLDGKLATGFASLAPARRRTPTRPFPDLTDREFEVLELIAEGRNNTEIARSLFLNDKTVRNHVSHVFAKLHVPDRAGAIVLAHRHEVGTQREATR